MQIAAVHAALDAMEAAPAAEVAPAPERTVSAVDKSKPLQLAAKVAGEEAAPDEAGEVEAEATTEAEASADAATDAPATEQAPAALALPEDAIFTPEALATPEGIDAARKWLKDQRVEHSRQVIKGKKWHAKLKERARAQSERETMLVQIGTEQRQAAQSLLSGGAKEIASALGRITGRDPIPLIRELSMLIATDGKNNGKGDPKIEELRAELDGIKQRDEERAAAAKAAQEEAAFEQAKDGVLRMAQDGAQYPLLAAYAAKNAEQAAEVRETVSDLVIKAYKAGTPITPAQAARHYELLLEAENKASPAASVSGAAQTAKPAPAPVAKTAQGLTSRDTSTAPKRRPRGEPESVEELAADSRFLSQLGLG